MPDKAGADAPAKPVPVDPPKIIEHEVPKTFGLGVKPWRVQDPGDDPSNGTTFGVVVTPLTVKGPGPASPFGIGVTPYGVGTTGGTGPHFVTQYGPVIRKGNKAVDAKEGKPADPPSGGVQSQIGQSAPPSPGGGTSGGATFAALLPEYVLPLRGGYEPDTRFQLKSARTHSDMSPLPLGTITIRAMATDEGAQRDLVAPVDNRLCAVNRGIGMAADFGTRVCDVGFEGELDTKWTARLQTAWRVLRMPSGDKSLAGNRANSLSWTIGRTGMGDELGGFVSDGPRSEAVHAHVSCRNGGPFDVGDGAGRFADKHQIGVTHDGQPINALHFSTGTLFNAPPSWAKDGPLVFKNAGYDYTAQDGTAPQRVHLVFNPQAPYDFERDGRVRMFGAWEWITYASVYEIKTPDDYDPPPPPYRRPPPTTGGGDNDPPTTPGGGDPTGPTTPGGGGRQGGGNGPGFTPPTPPTGAPGGAGGGGGTGPQGAGAAGAGIQFGAVAAVIKEMLAGPIASRAQLLGQGLPDYAHAHTIPADDRLAFDRTAPVTLRQTPFARQRNGAYVRTLEPGFSQFPGGSASGGLFFHVPEVGPIDADSGFEPPGVALSDAAVVFGPRVSTVWGTIDPETGTVDDGVRVVRAGTGSVNVETWSGTAWVPLLEVSASGIVVKAGASVTLEDGVNVGIAAATGTQFGDGSAKLGFYGATPTVQGAAIADAVDAADLLTKFNTWLARARAMGVIAP